MKRLHTKGFTLIELLVTLAIIGILATIVFRGMHAADTRSRDKQRKSDLRTLQTAIEQYKQKNGVYPDMGIDTDGDGWSSELESTNAYIVGLTPEFIPRLPHDPKISAGGKGYNYVTNNNTVYKLIAMNTVESEVVDNTNEFKSCDTTTQIKKPPYLVGNPYELLCTGPVTLNSGSTPNECQESDSRFQKSYAVWGGWAPSQTTNTNFRWPNGSLDLTQLIVCKVNQS